MFVKEDFVKLLVDSVGEVPAGRIFKALFDGSRAPACIRLNPFKAPDPSVASLPQDDGRRCIPPQDDVGVLRHSNVCVVRHSDAKHEVRSEESRVAPDPSVASLPQDDESVLRHSNVCVVRHSDAKPVGRSEESRVAWNKWGRVLAERPVFTLDPLFHAGCYYVQDSSSMAVGALFRDLLRHSNVGVFRHSDAEPAGRSEESRVALDPSVASLPQDDGSRCIPPQDDGVIRVLDLCAAPGGKTTDLATSLRECYGDNFILIANEVVPSRAAVLRDNVSAWGEPNVYVTSLDPKVFGQRLPEWFDIILTDVPCSGEGMFRKEEDAVSGWSIDAVKMCAKRSRGILENVVPALKNGGYLIYSTCTFNHYENDDNIQYLLDEQCFIHLPLSEQFVEKFGDALLKTRYGGLLAPGYVNGEGQYFAVVKKSGTTAVESATTGKALTKGDGNFRREESRKVDKHFVEQILAPREYFSLKGRDRIPTHELASLAGWTMRSCGEGIPVAVAPASCGSGLLEFPRYEATLKGAQKYLRRENIVLPKEYAKGYVLITYKNVPIGFVNNLIVRTNNLYPKSRAIRMQIL